MKRTNLIIAIVMLLCALSAPAAAEESVKAPARCDAECRAFERAAFRVSVAALFDRLRDRTSPAERAPKLTYSLERQGDADEAGANEICVGVC